MKIFTSIGFLVISVASLAQKNKVVFSIEPRSVAVGEVVVLEIESTIQGEIEIDNLPSSFVQSQGSQSNFRTDIDVNTGKIITYYQFLQTGAFSRAGKYTIGPVFIKQGNVTYSSNKVVVHVGESADMISSELTAQQLRDPAFGVIQTNKTTLYEGEPILVNAKVYARFKPTYIERYTPYAMKGGIDSHPIGTGDPKISMEQFRGMNTYSFEYDKNLIFPVGTGDFRIRSFTMSLYDDYRAFSLTSSSALITIKPLPANPPKDFIGAVGYFEIERFVEDHNLKQGDVFKLKIVISGSGNLQNILEPRPDLPKGFIIYGDPMIEENYSYTSRGAEGSISYEYNVQVSEYGDLTLPASTVSYFNVEDEKYVTIQTTENVLAVRKNKDFVVQELGSEDDADAEKIDELSQLRKSEIHDPANDLYGTVLFWSGLGLPFATALLFLLVMKRREKSENEIATRQQLRKVENELVKELAQLKLHLAAGHYTEVFSGIDGIMRKAIEKRVLLVDLNCSRQELLAALEHHKMTATAEKSQRLMNICDQNRYGFGADADAAHSAVEELNRILDDLK